MFEIKDIVNAFINREPLARNGIWFSRGDEDRVQEILDALENEGFAPTRYLKEKLRDGDYNMGRFFLYNKISIFYSDVLQGVELDINEVNFGCLDENFEDLI